MIRLLLTLACWLLPYSLAPLSSAAELPKLEKTGQRVFLATPKRGVQIRAQAYYTQKTGGELFCRYMYQTRSDTFDAAFEMRSADNGQTWSEPVQQATFEKVAGGTRRISERAGYVDPATGILLVIGGEIVLPKDNPLEALSGRGRTTYKLSRDGGRTFYHSAPLISTGEKFSLEHPHPGVWSGKNAVQIGDASSLPITLKSGEILQPVQVSPLGPDGKYFNPGGGYTYHDTAVLIGTWNDKQTLDWRMSEKIVGDPKLSTRGMLEPTLAQFADGRVLCVMRGSNDSAGKLKGYRWQSVSSDGGQTWTKPEPWKYTTGEAFFSPSSCSRLMTHSTGHTLWIGNITPKNPRANTPRYPLVIGIVDPESLQLVKESVIQIDTRQPEDHPQMTLSNFYIREDRETGEIVIYVSTIGRHHELSQNNLKAAREWTSDSTEYRVRLVPP